MHKHYGINYDKIICWEHPNFADFIIEQLDAHFERHRLKLHPFPWLPIDFNLIASFVFKKNPKNGIVKFQSRLIENAMKKIVDKWENVK